MIQRLLDKIGLLKGPTATGRFTITKPGEAFVSELDKVSHLDNFGKQQTIVGKTKFFDQTAEQYRELEEILSSVPKGVVLECAAGVVGSKVEFLIKEKPTNYSDQQTKELLEKLNEIGFKYSLADQQNRSVEPNKSECIDELEKSGCANVVQFDWDLQYVEETELEGITDIAEQYGLAMAQGFNGYLEIWLDDDGKFRCQTTDFSSVKIDRGVKGITVTNDSSFSIGTKQDAKEWVQVWWPRLNDLSNS